MSGRTGFAVVVVTTAGHRSATDAVTAARAAGDVIDDALAAEMRRTQATWLAGSSLPALLARFIEQTCSEQSQREIIARLSHAVGAES